MSTYFGAPWPSGICDDGTQVPTPVGELCINCEEPIGPDDQGSFVGVWAKGSSRQAPTHKECSLRSVLGGIEHLTAGPHKEGTCYEGSTLTYRQSALAAWDWLQSHPGQTGPQVLR